MIKEQKVPAINSIQVIRGLACVLVVLHHGGENTKIIFDIPFLFDFFKFGYAALDIFFVLSGFIITYTSMPHIGEKENLGNFLKRRFVRIYPIYWLIISGFLVVQALVPAYYKTLYPLEFSTLLSTYLILPQHIMVNGVSWSLTYEIFFYLLFPMAFLIKSKKLLVVILSVCTLSLLIFTLFFSANVEMGKVLFLVAFPMNIEFLMGVFAAILYTHIPPKYSVHYIITGLVLFCIGSALINYDLNMMRLLVNRIFYFGIPSMLIIMGVAVFESNGKTKKFPRILIDLGDASYSLYLLHLPVLVALLKIVQMKGITNAVLIQVLLVVFIIAICFGSILFYKKVERPLVRRINRLLHAKSSTKYRKEQNK
ncbi:MAG TPA: acyltransferase [Chitinophagaceae bacterium]|jgi:peptidoglycan/LPS O-acetylase OafA/YrhL|nr:acyltransferase [Chitinophagaceae bacterium]